MSKEILLNGLNPRQKEAVLHEGGPLLVLANAGNSKTRVITHKFAYYTKKSNKVSPHSILAVTFTNKASDEMKRRIALLIGKDMDSSG